VESNGKLTFWRVFFLVQFSWKILNWHIRGILFWLTDLLINTWILSWLQYEYVQNKILYTKVIWQFIQTTLCRYNNEIQQLNPLTPNDPYSGRTASLTSKRCILYIYSTNISTEYFKHGIYCTCFSLQIAVCFIILTYLVPVLFTFYIQVC